MDSDIKLVSVILATYNGEAYLEQQLQSLFAQSYANTEIIAVDDSSTDNTVSILNKYALQYTNMKVYVNEKNIGFIKNFEKGCTLSKGELIAFCDQDDYWHSEKIKKLAEGIGDHSIIYCDSAVCNEHLQPTGKNIADVVNYRSWNNCLQLAVFCRIYAHAMLFTRSFYNEAYPFLDVIPPDWWLPFLSTFHGGMKYFPEALVQYRQHSSNYAGVVGGRSKKHANTSRHEKKKTDLYKIRKRINAFYAACPDNLVHEKKILYRLSKSYESFSLPNNFKRMLLFFRYHDIFLSVKKHSKLHRLLFCLKMFVKIK